MERWVLNNLIFTGCWDSEQGICKDEAESKQNVDYFLDNYPKEECFEAQFFWSLIQMKNIGIWFFTNT